jgi:hypothetical protein
VELPTYTSIWRIEKRLYKLYDFRLPMPLPVGQIAVFPAVTVPCIVLLTLFGVPVNHDLFWLYALPPGLLIWLATRQVLESKRLTKLIISQARYAREPSTWCRLALLADKDQIAMFSGGWRRAALPVVTAEQEGLEQREAARGLRARERAALPVASSAQGVSGQPVAEQPVRGRAGTRLLNGMARRMPKAIFLDEAWAITSTPEGAKLVPEVSRMGRSRNTALILVSQNAGDLLAEHNPRPYHDAQKAEIHMVLRGAMKGQATMAYP